MRTLPTLVATLAAAVVFVLPAGGAPDVIRSATHDFDIAVLSGPPTMVSGGDALVRVTVPRVVPLPKVTITLNGAPITPAFAVDAAARTMTALVTGLDVGDNRLFVDSNGLGNGRPTAELTLVNHPLTGPIFSGPQQQPFVCKTEPQGLGQPLVDNQDGVGMPVFAVTGDRTSPIVGWSKDCSAATKVDFLYRTTGGSFRPLPAGPRPADMAQTTTLDGRTVDYVVRRERGTIDRFIYSISVLSPAGSPTDPADLSLWNRRLLYSFDGGVGIGHNQGTLGGNALYHSGLSAGYAVVYSSGTRTGVHYNLQLGAETAIMLKEHFIEAYGVPSYTVGVGGSGGAIQQYVYAQNFPGVIIDAAIPQYSYPDMITQSIHVGDCELLEYYMDVTNGANPKWAFWPNRSWLEGLAASATFRNPYRGGLPGSTECINGWRGLTPLAFNPLYGEAGTGQELYPPAVMAAVKWTHWDDLRNIYGVDADGYARVTWDNVGVQYGLQALRDGRITPAEFLDVNARAGSWRQTKDMVQEGCPFYPVPGCFNPLSWDPWSSRNMRLSPDGGVTPAPRTAGNLDAMHAAYESGMVFRGDIGIPVIDWRHYLEQALNMHNSHQSFASRQRMLNFDGDASNQVIWFTDARPAPVSDATPLALAVIDEWLANIAAHPERSVAENKPAQAVDSCFATDGTLIASGDGVWDGILDGRPAGACTAHFPLNSTSRIVAGGPIEGGIFKCQLKPVATALTDGTYAPWVPSAADAARLEQVFPTGVCNYGKPDAGRPPGW